MNHPDFILSADNHLTWKVPSERSDDFSAAMWEKMAFVRDLSEKYNCWVLNAGDTFDTWRSDKDSMMIEWLSKAIDYLPMRFITVYGQHELPNHSETNKSRSPLELLRRMGRITVLPDNGYLQLGRWKVYGAGYGHNQKVKGNPNSILVMHRMVWKGEPPYPGAPNEGTVERVMDDNPGHRLIVSGDNHTPFTHTQGYRTLVNCGSMMRRTVAQKDYEPAVWLWSAKEGLERVPLPIKKDVWKKQAVVSVGQEEFQIVRQIKNTKGTKQDFESHMRLAMKGQPHPVKVKVQSLMRDVK